jgi:hypothetical protein
LEDGLVFGDKGLGWLGRRLGLLTKKGRRQEAQGRREEGEKKFYSLYFCFLAMMLCIIPNPP